MWMRERGERKREDLVSRKDGKRNKSKKKTLRIEGLFGTDKLRI